MTVDQAGTLGRGPDRLDPSRATDPSVPIGLSPAAAHIRELSISEWGEDRAIGQYILNTSQTVARIEQRGRISSLNTSVAAGIAMHALSRERGSAC